MKLRRSRGIAILISLFVTVLVVMFVTAMVTLLPQNSDAARNSKEGKAALAAARAGVEYAWCRVQENPNWLGDGNAWVVNTTGLAVLEDHGSVFGFLTSPSGELSQFRLRFNYQNGGNPVGGASGTPSSAYMIKSPYVSVNNLNGAAAAKVPLGDTSQSNCAVTATALASAPASCTNFNTDLFIEGLAGDGMRNITPANPNPVSGNRRVVSRVLEIGLARANVAGLDSAIYGSSITGAGLTDKLDVQSATGAAPMSRSLTNIDMSGGPGSYTSSASGRVTIGSSSTFNGGPATSISGNAIRRDPNQTNKWLKLTSNDISKATSSGSVAKAGTYVWHADHTLTYVAQNYTGTIPSGGVQIDTGNQQNYLGTGMVIDPSTFSIGVTANTFVDNATSVKSFSVVADPAIANTLFDRPKAVFNATNAPIMSAQGSIYLDGALIGNGAVTSDSNITFQGPSVFETAATKSVAVYAKNDVNLLKIPDPVAMELMAPAPTNINGNYNSHGNHGHTSRHHLGHHNSNGHTQGTTNNVFNAITGPLGTINGDDVIVGGIVYAGHNFNSNLGAAGNLYIKGVLEAYGGNPDAQGALAAPGLSGGVVNMTGHAAQVTYDPKYVVQSMQLSAPARLSLVLYNAF